jgi:hypothetical protein
MNKNLSISEEIKEPEKKKEKKNQIIGYGKKGSVIVKSLHKEAKNEVVVKEITKNGRTPN